MRRRADRDEHRVRTLVRLPDFGGEGKPPCCYIRRNRLIMVSPAGFEPATY